MVSNISLPFAKLLERIRSALPSSPPVYLVGGALRDALLACPTHDLDFVFSGNGLALGRRVAKALGAEFFPLDELRDTARLIFVQPDGSRLLLDFASFRGPDLESDLRARDFTINAMAMSLQELNEIIDPLGGVPDLREKRLRACSASTFQDDPLRVLRGIRLGVEFGFQIESDTKIYMRQAVASLPRISPERLRDELFRALDGPAPASAVRGLDLLGALPYILPELQALKGLDQSPPHKSDAWEHTLNVLQKLTRVLGVLALPVDPDASASFSLGLVSLRLGRYRENLSAHLRTTLNLDRSLRAHYFLAALYHDIGKSETCLVDEKGRVRFFGHEQVGAEIVTRRGTKLRLSNLEIDRLRTIVRYHMRPLMIAQTGAPPTRRAIYRFFRNSGPAGVDICLLSLADTLATFGSGLPQDLWSDHLDVVRALLEAWWEKPTAVVSPPVLLTGTALMDALDLQPGPQIGKILELIRENQATGEIEDSQAAIELARRWLAGGSGESDRGEELDQG